MSDREYMREAGLNARSRYFSTWTITRSLVAVNAAIFFAREIVGTFGTSDEPSWVILFFAHPLNLLNGYAWTLVTYAFFHGSLLHLVANMAGLWCIGEHIERTEGRGRLLGIYFGGVIAGVLLWLALVNRQSPPLIGASAGVFATLTYALLQDFNAPIRDLVYFAIPVTLRAKWLLAIIGAFTLCGMFLSEIPARTHWWRALWNDNIAHSAHLGGMLLGAAACAMVFLRYRGRARRDPPIRISRLIPCRQTVNIPSMDPAATPGKIPFPSPTHLRTLPKPSPASILPITPMTAAALEDEVNRILDKINTTGLHSLTLDEHHTLEAARDALLRKE
ncbi:MAG: rhomboid family intramembrane serine protease [Puniceicoccales bacterium]|nr:rhomboid family intramembrane serine protease [Puniceicoccales bacterium]